MYSCGLFYDILTIDTSIVLPLFRGVPAAVSGSRVGVPWSDKKSLKESTGNSVLDMLAAGSEW